MKKIKPILAKEQSFLWKQAIRNAEKRGYNTRTILLAPLLSAMFSFKNHHSYLFDHLIIGSNPILTYQIILKLHQNTIHISGQDPIRIGVLFTDEPDYWAYHTLEKKEAWDELSHLSDNDWPSNFKQLLKQHNNLFLDKSQHELTFIDSSNMSIDSCCYDKYMDGYVINMKDKIHRIDTSYTKKMPTVLESERKISAQYKNDLFDFFNHHPNKNNMNVNSLVFPDEKTSCDDNALATHLLLSKQIWLTSQPHGWLQTQVENDNAVISYQDSIIAETTFKHLLIKNSFGTGKHIANDFNALEIQTLFDILEIEKLDDLSSADNKSLYFDTKLNRRK